MNEKLPKLLDGLTLISQSTIRDDAYSVFGTFDGKTKAEGEGGTSDKVEASLKVGKVVFYGCSISTPYRRYERVL